MSIIICSCTKGKKEHTKLFQSIDSYLPYHFIENNKQSLAYNYNKFIAVLSSQYDYIVLAHDDVYIPHPEVLEQELLSNTEYDVIGLAGAQSISIKKPTLWHLMSKREDWRGAVSHSINDKQHMVTSFGPMPSRCLVIDGLFIAIKTSSFNGEILFDESNKGKWHLYDMDFCLTCNTLHKKIGVLDIPVIHSSAGLKSLDDKSFLLSQEWFISKWQKP